MKVWLNLARVAVATLLSLGLAAAWLVAPDPVFSNTEASREATPISLEPRPLQLVCPGSAVRLGGEAGTEVGLIERIGSASLNLQSSDGSSNVSFEAQFTEFQTIELDSALEQSSNLLSAWQWQQVRAPRISGAAAAACVSPNRDQWFVAGSTDAQADSVLLVHNPSAVEAAISVEAFGGATAETDFALAPGATELLSLATLLPRSEGFVVRVSASTPVASWLQHRTSRGLSATGFDLAAGQAGPSRELTIAGVRVLGSEFAPLPALTTPVLRVFNPGAEPLEALVQVISSEGGFGTALRLVVNPGQIDSADLTGLDEGDYVIFVSSDQPVLAGVMNPVALALDSFDFAWLSANELFSGPFAIAGAADDVRLAIANPADRPISILVVVGDLQRQLLLAGRSQQVIAVPANTDIRVSSTEQVAATLQISGLGYAVVQARESGNMPSEISVLVR